jgi:hypothetical protein
MAGLLVNLGESRMLGLIVNKDTTTRDLVLKLYKSNTTPADTDTAGTYTEATFTGYSNVTLTGASWTVTEANPSTATYGQQTFTSSTGSQNETVYGYFLTTATEGRLICAERFSDGPYTIVNNGDAIKVTPSISLKDVSE